MIGGVFLHHLFYEVLGAQKGTRYAYAGRRFGLRGRLYISRSSLDNRETYVQGSIEPQGSSYESLLVIFLNAFFSIRTDIIPPPQAEAGMLKRVGGEEW